MLDETDLPMLNGLGPPEETVQISIKADGMVQAVVDRVAAMLERIGITGELVFSGGVANNSCIAQMLEKKLSRPVFVPKIPDIVGALGAALHQT